VHPEKPAAPHGAFGERSTRASYSYQRIVLVPHPTEGRFANRPLNAHELKGSIFQRVAPEKPAAPHGAFGERAKREYSPDTAAKHPTEDNLLQGAPKGDAPRGTIYRSEGTPRKDD
jgi:hypothetical protein